MFKKGKSRSKQCMSSPPVMKKPKSSESMRMKRICQLEEDIEDISDQLNFKEKRREQAIFAKNYKLCDQLTDEMSSLKKQKREYQNELVLWKKKQKQANWYRNKIKEKDERSISEEYDSCMSSMSSSTCTSHSLSTTPQRLWSPECSLSQNSTSLSPEWSFRCSQHPISTGTSRRSRSPLQQPLSPSIACPMLEVSHGPLEDSTVMPATQADVPHGSTTCSQLESMTDAIVEKSHSTNSSLTIDQPPFLLMPSQSQQGLGGHNDKLANDSCTDMLMHKVCDGVYISLNKMSLPHYIKSRQEYCHRYHKIPCITCQKFISVALLILKDGLCLLPDAFNIVSPDIKYTTEKARRKLLQMPLIAITIGNAASGKSFTILLEYCRNVDYFRMHSIINRIVGMLEEQKSISLDRDHVRMLLQLAESNHERECISYAIFKATGVSPTKASEQYGLHNMKERSARVEEAIIETQRIHKVVDDVQNNHDFFLASFDTTQESCASDSDSDVTTNNEFETGLDIDSLLTPDLLDLCKATFESSGYNWFELQEVVESKLGECCTSAMAVLDSVYNALPTLGLTKDQLLLVNQSRQAYIACAADNDFESQCRAARVINGDIVSESESDHDTYQYGLIEPVNKLKCKLAFRQRMRRLRYKAIATLHFLSKKSGNRVNKILAECPNIGKVIEDFVSECNIGADSWRRTGVLTFDGNCKLPQKVTYERIRMHLQDVYKRHFSYGSVVQLCMARNKRRLSAKRYSGIARVTTRRARKGFTLKYNPDSHWSAAFYKGLNSIQLIDGKDICNINRDDAAGFRLDTLTTNRQYSTPTVQGREILTTRTDYVNKYPSILQTTSYNFTGTQSTGEVCIGVVKAPTSIHPKNPCQHSVDLEMLEEEVSHVFINQETGMPKSIDAIRVDGSCDEGPSHEEVQYYWTERHILKSKAATIVTTRSSGSSYLNRVELQNGCLSLGHSNTFIPSTLLGSCVDPQTGSIDKEKLAQNMNLAIDAYISRVDGCPCGTSKIHLYRGADSSEQQKLRKKLLIFLKSSNTKKEALRLEDPAVYANFERVWNVRNNHMVRGLPGYIFFLLCCHKRSCPHPRCQAGMPVSPSTWYANGPPLTMIPYLFQTRNAHGVTLHVHLHPVNHSVQDTIKHS